MSEYIMNTFGIVQDLADLHGEMSTPLYQAIMDVLLSRQREGIVRCRDCQSWFRGKCRKHVFTTTVDGTEYDEGAFSMDASDFCSLGELRGDA